MPRAVILIPGIMGSELYLGKKLVWPGSATELVLPYRKMDELLNVGLQPGQIIRKFSFVDQYGSLIDDLNRWGFAETAVPKTLYVFPYDWRRSNCEAAIGFAALVDKVFDDHSSQVEVSLVAHSMGGLIARYYLESGRFNNGKGFCSVRQLITLGTPHRGAPLALTAALGQERRLFLSKEQVATLVNDERYPSLYQLFPPEGEPFVWDDGPAAEYRPRNVYEPQLAKDLNLTAKNLDAAKDLHRGLDLRRRPAAVRYFFFVGSHQRTATSVYLQGQNAAGARSLEADHSGDGTVPIWSASMTGVQGLSVGGEHGVIYQNQRLRSTLAGLLGAVPRLGAKIPRIEVAVRDRVVEPDAEMHLTLEFHEKIQDISAVLSFRELDESGAPKAGRRSTPGKLLRYSGVAVDSIGVVLTAPDRSGFYRVLVRDATSKKLYGAGDLIVQASSNQRAPATKASYKKGRRIPQARNRSSWA